MGACDKYLGWAKYYFCTIVGLRKTQVMRAFVSPLANLSGCSRPLPLTAHHLLFAESCRQRHGNPRDHQLDPWVLQGRRLSQVLRALVESSLRMHHGRHGIASSRGTLIAPIRLHPIPVWTRDVLPSSRLPVRARTPPLASPALGSQRDRLCVLSAVSWRTTVPSPLLPASPRSLWASSRSSSGVRLQLPTLSRLP